MRVGGRCSGLRPVDGIVGGIFSALGNNLYDPGDGRCMYCLCVVGAVCNLFGVWGS